MLPNLTDSSKLKEASFIHKILEFRLRAMLNPYRKLVNKLILFFEDKIYANKEKKLNEILEDVILWENLALR